MSFTFNFLIEISSIIVLVLSGIGWIIRTIYKNSKEKQKRFDLYDTAITNWYNNRQTHIPVARNKYEEFIFVEMNGKQKTSYSQFLSQNKITDENEFKKWIKVKKDKR